MYKRIMVPTDCSGFDREAVRLALRLAERLGAELHLVRVLTSGAYFGAGDAESRAGSELHSIKRARRQALTELYALAIECRRVSAVHVTVGLESGPVADALARYARRNDVDLIVISSHGRSGVSRLSLGSVTDSLIRHTTIPVLVVKPTASYLNPQVRGTLRKIVIPLDGSSLAEQILEPVMKLAALDDAHITLLSVLKRKGSAREQMMADWWEKDVAAARAYLARVAERLRVGRISVVTEVLVSNNVADEIAAYAGNEDADLIAIATHGRSGLTRVLRGSVADAVTRGAPTSILVFHPQVVENARYMDSAGRVRLTRQPQQLSVGRVGDDKERAIGCLSEIADASTHVQTLLHTDALDAVHLQADD